MLRKITSFSIRYSSWVIGFWFVLTGILGSFAVQLPSVLGDHGLVTNGQYAQVQKVLSRQFHIPDEPVIVLFNNDKGMSKRAFHSYILRTLNTVERISGVNVAASPLNRQELEKGNYAYALLSVLPGSTPDKLRTMEQIREAASGDQNYRVTITGKPVIQEDVNRSSKHDLKAAERIGIPVAFVFLVFTLGGLVPASIPIIAGAMTVIIAMGIMYGIGVYGGMPLSVFVYNVIPMVGMAVCIDFALLMVSRFREERVHLSVNEALLQTMATSGKAIVVSVACVSLALIGTFYIRMPIFNSVSLGALVVLAVSLLVNLTFVPALLYKLRKRISSNVRNGNVHRGRSPWYLFIAVVMKRPLVSAGLAIGVLFICLYPIRAMQVSIPGPESLPKDKESRMASEIVIERFQPRFVSQALMIVKDKVDGDGVGIPSQQIVDQIRRELGQDPIVIDMEIEKSSGRKGLHLISVWLKGNETSKEVMEWVRERADKYGALDVQIGGEPKYHQEVHDEVFTRMKFVLVFVLLSNFIVLCVAFRSLFIPLKAILMNLVSIGASFGILTWLFQEGRFGMEPTDIAIMIPVFIFGLTFGISMDYGIFLLSRIQESYRNTGDNDHAIREGMTGSGKIITSAAAIMIAVTAPFAVADVSGVKQLGMGIAVALFLDATIVRMVLVPSLMKCLGKWNWWMPFVKN